MKRLIVSTTAIIFVLLILSQLSAESFLPPLLDSETEAAKGLASLLGISCYWHKPKLYQYFLTPRKDLKQNLICKTPLSASSDETNHQLAQNLKAHYGENVESFFAKTAITIGLKGQDVMACFFPQRTIKWVWCEKNTELGCYYGDCGRGLVSQ